MTKKSARCINTDIEIFVPYVQKDIPSEEIKTGEEDDDNGDNLLKESNDSEFEQSLIKHNTSHVPLNTSSTQQHVQPPQPNLTSVFFSCSRSDD